MFFCFRLKRDHEGGEEEGGEAAGLGGIADVNLFFSKKRCSTAMSAKNALSFVRLNFSDACITMNGLYLDVSGELPSNAGFRELQARVARLYKLEFGCPAKSVKYIDHFQRGAEGDGEFKLDAHADEDADEDQHHPHHTHEEHHHHRHADEGADPRTVLRIDGLWENDSHVGFSHKFYYRCRECSRL